MVLMLHAFIDESGQRGHADAASPHFLLGAAVVRTSNLERVTDSMAQLREDLRRPADSYLSWKNFRSHSDRLHIAESLGSFTWMKSITVVACKRHLDPGSLNVDQMYMYQFRLLLERLSWLARQHGEVASYTLAHIRKFKIETLREYESRLREIQTEIAWGHVDPKGGSIDQPQRDERLQVADLVVSAQASAFNPDRHGRTERRYLEATAPVIYRYSKGSSVASYGLKMHPWTDTTKAAYPWVAAL
jgi:hypothetical protein